ncbi:MFS general substrate transporter [Meredithblackwellia eburnea MCA 4105]
MQRTISVDPPSIVVAPGCIPVDPAALPEEDSSQLENNGELDLKEKENDRIPMAELEYPEGGLPAYLTVAGSAICLVTMFAMSNTWGALQAELKNNQLKGYSQSAISWIGSAGIALIYAGGLPAGRMFDAGFMRYEIITGALVYLLGVYTLSVSKQFYSIFISYAILTGPPEGNNLTQVGGALLFTPSVSAVGTYFKRRRGSMVAIVVASSALGSVAFPIMLNQLFAKIGFGKTIRALAYLQTGCFVLVNLLIRPRKLPPKVQPPLRATLMKFTRQPLTWVLSIGTALIIMGIWIPLFYIQVYLQAHNAPPVLLKYCIAITNGAAVVGRLSSGPIADRIGTLNAAVPYSFVTGVLCFALIGAKSFGASVTWLVLYGIANGLFVTILTPILMTLAEDVSEIGMRVGYGLFLVAIATLIGSPIAGALLSAAGGSYAAPFSFAGAACIAGSGLLAIARFSQARSRGTQKV